MPLTPEEASSAYTTLTRIARENSLAWVVKQVEDQISLGHVTLKSLPSKRKKESLAFEEFFVRVRSDDGANRERSKSFFTVSEEYSDIERLSLIVEAIITATTDLNQIAEALTEFKCGEFEFTHLAFEPEAEVESAFELSRSEVTARHAAAVHLRALLEEIKAELGE